MQLDEDTLPDYARGAAILGAGGGGSTQVALLAALQAVQELGPADVIPLADVPDDALVVPVGGLGSPDITLEKLGNPEQGVWLRELIERETGRRAFAYMPCEIGGSNAILPVMWALHAGLPLVDADGMGRAFPEVQMVSMHLAGVAATPTVLVDERGHKALFRDMAAAQLEHAARAASVALGGLVAQVDHVMTGTQARAGGAIEGSITRAHHLGAALTAAPRHRIPALLDKLSGRALVTGKISDVARRTTGGFVRGHVLIDGTGADRGRLVRVEIQNENLVVMEDGEVLATVPDIITLLDSHTGDAIFTETMRYGQRVTLVVLPAPEIWRTPRGLELTGPRAFGYEFDHLPMEAVGTAPAAKAAP